MQKSRTHCPTGPLCTHRWNMPRSSCRVKGPSILPPAFVNTHCPLASCSQGRGVGDRGRRVLGGGGAAVGQDGWTGEGGKPRGSSKAEGRQGQSGEAVPSALASSAACASASIAASSICCWCCSHSQCRCCSSCARWSAQACRRPPPSRCCCCQSSSCCCGSGGLCGCCTRCCCSCLSRNSRAANGSGRSTACMYRQPANSSDPTHQKQHLQARTKQGCSVQQEPSQHTRNPPPTQGSHPCPGPTRSSGISPRRGCRTAVSAAAAPTL